MRRSVLAFALVAMTVLAGCGLLPDGGPEHRVIVQNHDGRDHRVEVVISKGDTVVLQDTRSVSSGERWRVLNITDTGEHTIAVTAENGAVAERTHELPLQSSRNSYTLLSLDERGSWDVQVLREQSPET